jgi:hypothetical protein
MMAAVACLGLSVCAGPQVQAHWVKAGFDDTATSREADDCRAQANAAHNNEQGIDEDISATLGRNWQLSNTTRLEDQTMRQQAAGIADQVFNNCMRAKGFSKTG